MGLSGHQVVVRVGQMEGMVVGALGGLGVAALGRTSLHTNCPTSPCPRDRVARVLIIGVVLLVVNPVLSSNSRQTFTNRDSNSWTIKQQLH